MAMPAVTNKASLLAKNALRVSTVTTAIANITTPADFIPKSNGMIICITFFFLCLRPEIYNRNISKKIETPILLYWTEIHQLFIGQY